MSPLSETTHPHWYHRTNAEGIIEASQNWEELNRVIEELLEANTAHGFKPQSEVDQLKLGQQVNSWKATILSLGKVLRQIELKADHPIILETILRGRNKIDAIVCGADRKGHPGAAVIECKAHHHRRRGSDHTYKYDFLPSHDSGKVVSIFIDHPKSEMQIPQARIDEKYHWQIWKYIHELRNRFGAAHKNDVHLSPMLYFYNTDYLPKKWRRTLLENVPAPMKEIPVFTRLKIS